MAQLTDTLRGFGQIKLALMAMVAMALIAAFAVLTMRITSPALSPLYNGLAPEDSAKIVTELGKLGVPYDMQNNGATIMVPAERVLRLRMTMAEAGLPSNGSVVGYEIFDKSETFGSSNFVMTVNLERALEGELSRTIGSFQQVESARVHLVMPKRELFTSERNEPSASVALKLRGGQELSKQEVASITHFVAAAVPGLKVSRVTVVDSYGRLLARGEGEQEVGAVAAASEEYRASYENHMRERLEDMLEKIVGPGKAKVQVAADINFDRLVTDSEKFDPEGQVVRSTQSTNEKDTAQDKASGGAVSVAGQVPGGQAAGGGAGGNSHNTEKADETTNYEISKTTSKQIKEGGTVNKVSVAVLVDGVYNADDKGNKTYAPRTEEDLKRIDQIVRSAIGFNEKRGDTVNVVNMQFTKFEEQTVAESFLSDFKNVAPGIVQTLIIAGVVVLAILVVLRPAAIYMMKQASRDAVPADDPMASLSAPMSAPRLPAGAGPMSATQAANEYAEAAEDDAMVDLQNIKGSVRSSTLRRVVNVVDKNPTEAMNVMRQWLVKEAT